ncbi:MAG: hypothetical protein IJU44_08335 [Kiritimatiellae bacterium]|nr:hypothetical protein [Kiritimatiellia bacterium]
MGSKSVLEVFRTASLLILLIFMGCASGRFIGDTSTHTLNKDIQLKSKYRVERICFTYPFDVRQGYRTAISAGMDKILQSYIKVQLSQIRPDVFTESSDAIPIVVNMYLHDENQICCGMTPYILTLGFLPGDTHEYCFYRINVQRMSDMKQTKNTIISIKYDFRFSLSSPLGLIGFGHDYNVAICRETSGSSREVELETIAAAVIEQLWQLENDVQVAMPSSIQQVAPSVISAETVQSIGVQPQLKDIEVLRDSGTITEKEYQDMVLRATERVK